MIAEIMLEDYRKIKEREEALYLKDWGEAIKENKRRDALPKNISEEIERWYESKDLEYLAYCKEQLLIFSKLYLKNLDKPVYRQLNAMVIKDIKNETEVTNARLHKYQTNQRSIRYRLAGDSTTAG